MTKTSCRSISYAPDRPAPSPQVRPGWTLCRNQSVFPIPDNTTLERWTEQGRVRSDDYLVNDSLDVCVQVRDVAELDVILRKARARAIGQVWQALACSALAFLWLAPLFGSLILATAVGAAGLKLWTMRHRAAYRLSTGAADARGRQTGGHARLLTVSVK